MTNGFLFDGAKIILDLCGGTGAWSAPYKEAGYNVLVVTTPGLDVCDFIPPDNVYGILAAPPCTEFSMARNGHPENPRDFKKGLQIVDACLRIIWRSRPHFWALENPAGHLSKWLGPPTIFFQPWHFGDPWTKNTALWGDFTPPQRLFRHRREVMTPADIALSRENRKPQDCGSGRNKAMKRATTPPGFARAFFEVNR